VVKVAVNHAYVDNDHAVTDDDEVILFPPIAGG
jgi:molybdopterin converting factor small subunit